MDRTAARAAAMKLVFEWEMGGNGGEDTVFGLLEIPKDDAEKYTKFADDLAALLGKEQGKFRAENGSAPDEEPFDPKAVIGKYIESEEEDTGFNLDDVLNPKGELDLEKLCRGLGLMDD